MDRKIGWFTTGRDMEAVTLLETIYRGTKEGRIKGHISFIFMNREEGEGPFSDQIMDMSREWGIPLATFSSARFKPEIRQEGRKSQEALLRWRDEYHQEVLKMLKGLASDFSVLAGYMLIVSPGMCHQLQMINLHPAPPNGPAGTWQEVIWQLIEMRAHESGVMIHVVTPELDKGPPITYCLYKIRNGGLSALWKDMDKKLKRMSLRDIVVKEGEGNDLFRMIRKEGVKRELPLLFETIRWLSDGRIVLKDQRIFMDNKAYPGGVCLTEQVEKIIANNA